MINNFYNKVKNFKEENITNKRLVLIFFVLIFGVVSLLDTYKREEDKKVQKKEEKEACHEFLSEKDFINCKSKSIEEKKEGEYTYFYFKEGKTKIFTGMASGGLARVDLSDIGKFICITNQPLSGGDDYILLEAGNINAVCLYEEKAKAVVIFQGQDKSYRDVYNEMWGEGEIQDNGEVK